MPSTFNLVEGWTAPIDWQLLLDEAVPVTSLSGTITLMAYDKNGVLLTTLVGAFVITSAPLWKVRYTPASATEILAVNSPMMVRTKMPDGSFLPNAGYDKWIVRKP